VWEGVGMEKPVNMGNSAIDNDKEKSKEKNKLEDEKNLDNKKEGGADTENENGELVSKESLGEGKDGGAAATNDPDKPKDNPQQGAPPKGTPPDPPKDNPPNEGNQTDSKDKKKRRHKKYKTTIDHKALKDLEGTTASSFLDLAKAVIVIDGKPYSEMTLTLSKERKNDFRRLIEHFAVLEVIGKRKYHVKRVYSKKQKEELQEMEIGIHRGKKKK